VKTATRESARKHILAVINNKLTLLKVIREDDFTDEEGETTEFFVCGSGVDGLPEIYVPCHAALFPEESCF